MQLPDEIDCYPVYLYNIRLYIVIIHHNYKYNTRFMMLYVDIYEYQQQLQRMLAAPAALCRPEVRNCAAGRLD